MYHRTVAGRWDAVAFGGCHGVGMKRRGPTFEHALGRPRARVLDSESLSALRRFIALAHYASVGGPGHSNCLLCQEAIRERARQQQLVRRQAYGQEPAAVQGAAQGAVQGAVQGAGQGAVQGAARGAA